MPTGWSRDDFEVAAQQIAAIHGLSGWMWDVNTHTLQLQQPIRKHHLQVDPPNEDDHQEETAAHTDPTVLWDDPDVVAAAVLKTTTTTTTTMWHASIVYSDLWKCPVFYFCVTDASNGAPLSRSNVVQYCSLPTTFDPDGDCVTYDQHPTHGAPSLLLHPCQTLERLAQFTSLNDNKAPFCKLWAWISMNMAAIDCPIAPQHYVSVLRECEERCRVVSCVGEK